MLKPKIPSSEVMEAYEKWVGILGLEPEWDLRIGTATQATHPGKMGEATTDWPDRTAEIFISEEYDEDHIEDTVLHELLHVLHGQIDFLFHIQKGQKVPKKVAEALYHEAIERFINRLTTILLEVQNGKKETR